MMERSSFLVDKLFRSSNFTHEVTQIHGDTVCLTTSILEDSLKTALNVSMGTHSSPGAVDRPGDPDPNRPRSTSVKIANGRLPL